GGLFLAVYAFVMVPVFVALAIVVVWQRRREQRIVASQLPAFAAAGWIVPSEVPLLSSLAGRQGWRAAVRRRSGREAAKAVADYQAAVTELAFPRDRLARGTAGPHGPIWHAQAVEAVRRARARARGAPAAPTAGRPRRPARRRPRRPATRPRRTAPAPPGRPHRPRPAFRGRRRRTTRRRRAFPPRPGAAEPRPLPTNGPFVGQVPTNAPFVGEEGVGTRRGEARHRASVRTAAAVNLGRAVWYPQWRDWNEE